MNILGLDVGFGFTKATNGKEFVIFKSLYGDSTELHFQPDLKGSSAASKLHVTVDDKTYFVGNFAESQSSIRLYTLDQKKLLSKFVKILALSATGCCYDGDVELNVVSGLPVGFLKRDYKLFKETIEGMHKIIIHHTDGNRVEKKIHIKSIQMMPQPIGSVFNLLMDDNGRITNKDIANQKIGVVDIGFRTTDFALFDHLQFVERGSTTMDTGISKCFSVIAGKLRQESGVDIELYRLFKSMESGVIKIKGKEFNISSLKQKVYNHAAEAIAADINRIWADDWDIDAIILTGGGSMELAAYLQPLIDGNVIPLENDVDTRLNNVQGYLKFGKYKWGAFSKTSSKKNATGADHPSTSTPEKNEFPTPSAISEEIDSENVEETDEMKKNSKLGWLKR